jgi:hypothetical protein
MLAKNPSFLAKAEAAGIVLGARVPIILTSRADNVRARMGPAPSRWPSRTVKDPKTPAGPNASNA